MGVLFPKKLATFRGGKNENVQVGFLHRVFSPGRAKLRACVKTLFGFLPTGKDVEKIHFFPFGGLKLDNGNWRYPQRCIFLGVYRQNLWLAASKLLLCQVPEAFAQARGDLIQFLQFPAMSAHILTQASMQSNKKIFTKRFNRGHNR